MYKQENFRVKFMCFVKRRKVFQTQTHDCFSQMGELHFCFLPFNSGFGDFSSGVVAAAAVSLRDDK
jgi:hypothetical protein